MILKMNYMHVLDYLRRRLEGVTRILSIVAVQWFIVTRAVRRKTVSPSARIIGRLLLTFSMVRQNGGSIVLPPPVLA